VLSSIRHRLRRARSALASPGSPADYKTIWNRAALVDAKDAILTGATDESFEATGLSDAEMVARHLTRAGDEVVLDIGCGIGRVERYLAPKVRELWAVDVSGEMIRAARERLAGVANVHLREIGGREFLSAFEDGKFDLVFSFLVLQHLEREDSFLYLRDAHRVLKPGGRLLTQFPNFLSDVYTRAFLEGADLPSRSPGRVRTYTEAEVRHSLSVAGFSVEELWYGGHGDQSAEMYVSGRKGS
jgi:SAM-dependent methyltransferase